MKPRIELIELDGGRRVAVHRLAEGDTGRVVVMCHIAPGAGTLDPDPERTWARGVTLLAVDRPGYGQSDPLPSGRWATVSSAADDLAAVLDRLGGAKVGMAGWSAGGRVALALAARRPDLVDRVVVIGTPAPHEEVPWIPPEEQAMLDALRGLPAEAVHATMNEQFGQMLAQFPSAGDALGLLGVSPADDTTLAKPGVREALATMMEAAFAQGATGIVADIAGYTLQPWGFDPQAVKAKTLLLYGSKDPVVGPRHANWWKERIPDSRVEMAPGAGHMLVFPLWERALSHLAPGAKRRQNTGVEIRPWSDGDLPLIERLMGDPAMTEHLGGPESPEKIRDRHERYLRLGDSGKGRMFVIVVGPGRVAAGSVGYWEREWRGQNVWETGWSVLPEFQGQGIATQAMAAVVERARAEGKHRYMLAFPSVDNAPSNAICRKLGFTLLEEEEFEYPPGNRMRCNDWSLDLFANTSKAPSA